MTVKILTGDCREELEKLAPESIQCCVCSPPYWGLRAYLPDGHPDTSKLIGLEKDPREYIANLVAVFRGVRRVLRRDGTLWVNMGDSYTDGGRGDDVGSTLQGTRRNQRESRRSRVREGNRPFGLGMKQLIMMPSRLAIAMQDDGWTLRSRIIWAKPNPMPESVRDRCTRAHEEIFLFVRSRHYYYDAKAIAEPTSGTAHPRGEKGYGPKAVARGARCDPGVWERKNQQVGRVNKIPSGWATDTDRRHDEKQGRYSAGGEGRPQSRLRIRQTKNNQDFLGATNGLVATRNKRDVWLIRPEAYSGKHSATFPKALVRPCLMAGTSPRSCELCGTAWKPEYGPPIETGDEGSGNKERKYRHEHGGPKGSKKRQAHAVPWKPATREIVGYAPRCKCDLASGTGRCVVLDPFGGAGTTALVADEMGLDSILIELNPDSVTEATDRVAAASPPAPRPEVA